jgi:hypothetical protein
VFDLSPLTEQSLIVLGVLFAVLIGITEVKLLGKVLPFRRPIRPPLKPPNNLPKAA